MRRRTALLLVGLTAVLLPAMSLGRAAEAQEAPLIEVTASYRETVVTVGDRVHLQVLVTHPDEVIVTVQRPIVRDAEYVSSSPMTEVRRPDGRIDSVTVFTLQVFALGEIPPVPLSVNWVREDGSSGNVAVQSASLTVLLIRTPGDTTLRPIADPLTVGGAPAAWLMPAVYAAAAVAVLVSVAVAVMAWRRRPATIDVVSDIDHPERSARERLGAVRSLTLSSDEDFQRYYGTIAEVVRGYLGERFQFNAAALTSAELEQRMRSHGVDRWQARLVSGLLERCDRAVYARHYPDPTSADHDLTVAYEIVELSRPRGDQAEEPAKVAAS